VEGRERRASKWFSDGVGVNALQGDCVCLIAFYHPSLQIPLLHQKVDMLEKPGTSWQAVFSGDENV
jgi:hypothetical protein